MNVKGYREAEVRSLASVGDQLVGLEATEDPLSDAQLFNTRGSGFDPALPMIKSGPQSISTTISSISISTTITTMGPLATAVPLLLCVLLGPVAASQAPKTVFLDKQQASTVMSRHKRANADGEEQTQAANLERECLEEVCAYEEAREVFQDSYRTVSVAISIVFLPPAWRCFLLTR
ncbi:Coagulation factor IX [Merluccius polli]|uniref:Coagulation factor IX n=1 Tax=Merluccius polli TaxID=89951 RepID=A0AA47MV66_MERPO|nr:Coagulation factor IX [Merluccius polli]